MEDLQYWNSLAGRREFTTPPRTEEIQNSFAKDAEILDVGCGYGRMLEWLWEAGYRNLHGADFSPNMITAASERLPLEVDLQVAKASGLPYADQSMDVVLLYGVLTCFADPKEDAESLRECYRVLKPGATLLLNEFLLNDDKSRYSLQQDQYGEFGTFRVENSATLKHTSADRLTALLSAWEIERSEQLPFRTMTGKIGLGISITAQKRS